MLQLGSSTLVGKFPRTQLFVDNYYIVDAREAARTAGPHTSEPDSSVTIALSLLGFF